MGVGLFLTLYFISTLVFFFILRVFKEEDDFDFVVAAIWPMSLIVWALAGIFLFVGNLAHKTKWYLKRKIYNDNSNN